MFSPISRRSRCDSSASTSVQRDHPRLQGLLAREGEQLAHQVGGAVGVLLDLHDVGEGLVARPVAQQQQIAEADHRRQQIVEVMGDAAGELADRLQAQGLGELGLQPFIAGAWRRWRERRIGRLLQRLDQRAERRTGPPLGRDIAAEPERMVGQDPATAAW